MARRYRFKTNKVKLDKKQNFLILSNHQSFLDPALVALTVYRPICFVASDALWSKKWYIRLLFYVFGPIKIRKGSADFACVRTLHSVAKEGGTICIFPEGNRQWNDSCFYIDRSIVKLVRLVKLPVILYNFRGGYGVQPRWGKDLRRGKYTGEIRDILPFERIRAMSDISGCMFDMMIIADVAAIDRNRFSAMWWQLLIICAVGTVATFAYIRLVSNHIYKGYEHEGFISMFGMLTGTASNGMILLREIDPKLETPASSNMVYSGLPAIAFGGALLLLLGYCPRGLTESIITFAILFVAFVVFTLVLFRIKIFRRKKGAVPVNGSAAETEGPPEQSPEQPPKIPPRRGTWNKARELRAEK